MVGILRIKDQNGEWQDIQALRGEQGPAGPAGKDGPVGPQGPKGADGTMTFSDLTEEQKESLRGPQGIQGPQGEKGEKGETGEKGADGAVGPQGPIGETGPQGEIGPQGPAGQDGKDGSDYVLTEEDKAEIAGMVEVTGGDADLTDYYTKSEVDAKIPEAVFKRGSGTYSIQTVNPNGSAMGYNTIAIGLANTGMFANRSIAIGNVVSTDMAEQMVIGKYNATVPEGANFIIGNGSAGNQRNALTVDNNNQVHIPGNLVVGEDKHLVATQRYVDDAVANAGGGNGSNLSVDGVTIINDNGVIRTAVGGFEYQGEMLVQLQGEYMSGEEYEIETADFENFVEMDGDTIIIGYDLDGEWFEDKYEVSYDEGSQEVVLESTKAEMTVVTINMASSTMVLEHGGEVVSILDIQTPSGVQPIGVDFIPVANGRGIEKRSSGLALDEDYIQDLMGDSYSIRHEDSNVGNALNNLKDAVEGVTYMDFLEGTDGTWEENTVVANMDILDEELYNNIMNDMANELLLSINIQGKTWGRGFGCNVWREESEGNILYVAGSFDEGFEFESVIIDTTNQQIRLAFRHDDFTGDEITEFTIRLMDIAKNVKFINPAEGIWVSRNNGGEEYVLGVKVDGSIGINDSGELRTQAGWIPYGDTNVGNKLDELQNQLDGVEFLNFWSGSNFVADSGALTLIADLVIDDEDIHDEVIVEDMVSGVELSCNYGEEGNWGRSFSSYFNRNEADDIVTYVCNFSGGYITQVIVDVTNSKITFIFAAGNEDFLTRNFNYMNLRLINVNRFVKQVRVGNGMYVNRNNGGEVQTVGINMDGTLRVSNNRLGVNTNGIFSITEEFLPMNWNIGPYDFSADYLSFTVSNRVTEDEFVEWIENVIADNPRLTLGISLADGTSFNGRCIPEITYEDTITDGDSTGHRAYTIDMSSAIGPNIQAMTGIYECIIRYTTNGDNRFTVELSRDTANTIANVNRIVWGYANTELGMAHYFIRNYEQFNIVNEDGYRYLEINESYINKLIDERIAAYHANA